MKICLLGPAPTHIGIQPIGTYINTILNDKDKFQVDNFRFAVAFAQDSLLSLMNESISEFLKKGGSIEAIIGVGSNGTSSKLLSRLLKICGPSNIFAYFNPSDALFHPKLYIITGDKKAYVIVGSSNFTLNGFMNNFEINMGLELDLENKEDEIIYSNFNDIYNQIKISPSSILLNKSLITTLKDIDILNGKRLNQTIKDISKSTREELKKIFKKTTQKRTTINVRKISRVKSPVYIMSLVENDVSGVGGNLIF